MAKEALDKVLSAELEAENIIKNAKESAKAIIKQSELDSSKKFEQMIREAKKKNEGIYDAVAAELKGELSEISSKSDVECKKTAEISKKNISKAKHFLKERIMS